MLFIREYDKENNYRTLNQADTVFQKARLGVLRGEKRFHVINPKGEDYDLVYEDNNELTLAQDEFPQNDLHKKELFYPSYLIYDEYDKDKLCLDIFDEFKGVCFYEINEYTVILAKIILDNTEKPVYFDDERIRWFIADNSRLHVGIPEDTRGLMRVRNSLVFMACLDVFDDIWYLTLFHNVFVMQWLTELPLSQVKYLEISVLKTEGIGSLIMNLFRAAEAFRKFGIEVVLKPKSSRYDDDFLEKYFNLSVTKEDSDDTNTIYACSYFALIQTRMVFIANPVLDTSILNAKFIDELKEYKDAVFGDKRMLGVLVRGTDYITSGFPRRALRLPALIEEIQKRIDAYGYDEIFLATEDLDYHEGILAAFPGKVRAVSQERFRISDFKDVTLISDLEKEKNSGTAYKTSVEDTTINYFYAIYLLSQCESLLCTPECNAAVMATVFNDGKYRQHEILYENAYES